MAAITSLALDDRSEQFGRPGPAQRVQNAANLSTFAARCTAVLSKHQWRPLPYVVSLCYSFASHVAAHLSLSLKAPRHNAIGLYSFGLKPT